jgi:hypothetical protein
MDPYAACPVTPAFYKGASRFDALGQYDGLLQKILSILNYQYRYFPYSVSPSAWPLL